MEQEALRTSKVLYWYQKYQNTFEEEDAAMKRGEYARGHYINALEDMLKSRLKPGERSGPLSDLKGKAPVRASSEDATDATCKGKAHQ